MSGDSALRHLKSFRGVVTALALATGLTAEELTVTDTVTVAGETTWIFVGSFRCDADSNVFFVPGNPDGTPPDTVVKVSADGKRSTRFSLKSIPELRDVSDGEVYSFALGHSGELYVPVRNAKGYSIVALDQNGAYRSKTWLGQVSVSEFAVFESGDFLLWAKSFKKEDSKPFLGLLDSAGGELRKIFLDRGPAPSPESTRGTTTKSRPGSRTQPGPGIIGVSLMEPAKDGKIYVTTVPPKGPVPVFAISPSGDTQRIDLIPPRRDVTLVSIKVSDRRLAAEYEGSRSPRSSRVNPPGWISVYDIQSGERIATYTRVRGSLLCYESGDGVPDAFTLLLGSEESHGIRLVHAAGRY